jgi:hypothetical protein
MADRLRRMPIEAEVAACDGEVSGDCQFLATTRPKHSAVIADPEPERCAGNLLCAGSDLADQVKFPWLTMAG